MGLLTVIPASVRLVIIRATISYGYASVVVIKIAAIKFEEFHHENPQILGGLNFSSTNFRMHLMDY